MLRDLVLCACLVLLSPLLSGCLPLLVRALTDPGGLASDVATVTADNAVTSLVESDAHAGLSEVDQSLGRLDELIASGADDGYSGDLGAIRNNIEESRYLLEQGNANPNENALMQGKGMRGDLAQRRVLDTRRLGDVDSDPSFTTISEYQQLEQIRLDDLRGNAFRPPRYQPNFVGNRFHDRGHMPLLPAKESVSGMSPLVYGIEMSSGQMRQGISHGSVDQRQRQHQQQRHNILRSSARQDRPLR
ncbi:MAG: hypothetical protein EA401_10085 [Planctomycetota bacterium]|nr:MAG: hypothetical protein EA401_10085 [Planctomycetota bacterium]